MNEFRTRVEKAIGDAVGEQGPVRKLVSEGDMELVCKGLSEIRKCLKVIKVRWCGLLLEKEITNKEGDGGWVEKETHKQGE